MRVNCPVVQENQVEDIDTVVEDPQAVNMNHIAIVLAQNTGLLWFIDN